MSQQQSYKTNTDVLVPPSAVGPPRASSNTSGIPTKASGSTSNPTSANNYNLPTNPINPQNPSNNEPNISTPVSPVITNRQTSPDRSTISANAFQTTSSCPTSGLASTSNDPNCSPFWNTFVQELSNKLWSCTVTDSADSPPTSWNSSLQNLAQNSWFTVKVTTTKNPQTTPSSLRTSFPSLLYLWQSITDDDLRRIENAEDEKKTEALIPRPPTNPAVGQLPPPPKKAKKAPPRKPRKPKRAPEPPPPSEPVDPSQIKIKKRKKKDPASDTTEEKKAPKKKIVKPPVKANKIRLRPSRPQARHLDKIFAAVRWTYNQIVAHLSTLSHKEVVGLVKNKQAAQSTLRPMFINNDQFLPGAPFEKHAWVATTFTDPRDHAMSDVIDAVSTAFKCGKTFDPHGHLKRSDPSARTFRLKFRRFDDPQQSVVITPANYNAPPRKQAKRPKKDLKARSPNWHETIHIRSAEPLPEQIDREHRLVRTRAGKFSLAVLRPLEIQPPPVATPDRLEKVIALDPGSRCFMTGFDASGLLYEWCPTDYRRIYRLCMHYDKLQSKIKTQRKHRARKKKAAQRMQQRIRDIVQEVHCKLAKWLCANYRVVLLPAFESSGMVPKIKSNGKKRVISSPAARSLLTWSHYKFRQRLLSKAREYPHCRVIVCDEQYTTQTCSQCFRLNPGVGSSKQFRCSGGCGARMGRDANAAKNILLRWLYKHGRRVEEGFSAQPPPPLSVKRCQNHSPRALRGVAATAG
jgi:transposase